MQSRTTRQFWRLFLDIPLGVQMDAKSAYRLFQSNTAHPGLQFKKLEGEDNIYSVRIGLVYAPLTTQLRLSPYEVTLPWFPFLDRKSVANVQGPYPWCGLSASSGCFQTK